MSSPGSPMMQIGSFTGTSSPSSASSFRTVPDAPAGTSMDDLSVSISHRTVPSSTTSPSATIQVVSRHDSTVLPSWGITTMVAIYSS